MSTAATRPDASDLEDPPSRRAWEYHTLEVAEPLPVEDLDGFGAKGWLMCGVVRSGGLIHYHFRRRSAGVRKE
jgi:hypothetical protein